MKVVLIRTKSAKHPILVPDRLLQEAQLGLMLLSLILLLIFLFDRKRDDHALVTVEGLLRGGKSQASVVED